MRDASSSARSERSGPLLLPLASAPLPASDGRGGEPRRSSLAELRHVFGGRALLALDDVELDTLAFGQGLEARPLNGRMMNEAVLLSVLGSDEAEPLAVVEPLD